MKTVIVYGPKASGKTRNREALRKHFGYKGVWDDFVIFRNSGLPSAGMLHLTYHTKGEIVKFLARRRSELSGDLLNIILISFRAAMKEIADAEAAGVDLSAPVQGRS